MSKTVNVTLSKSFDGFRYASTAIPDTEGDIDQIR